MGDPVSSAVKWIANLLIQEATLLYGVRGQVEDLLAELREMQCFLKGADARQDEHPTIRNLVTEIREVAYEAENVIASFLFKVEPRRGKGLGNFLRRSVCILGEAKDRHNIASEINSIKANITRFKAGLQSYGIIAIAQERQASSSTVQRQLLVRTTYSHVVEEDFVGCKPDINILLSHLVGEEAKNHRAISICGMGGLGKTTLAKKVYHHTDIKCHFEAFAWVSISQQWLLKDVLQRILTKLLPHESDTIANMIEDQLVEQLYEVQRKKKCLVVLDDIWSPEAWVRLSPAFPMGRVENNGSKIILTTRNKEVPAVVDQGVFLHEPKCLTKEESWELFEKKAFSEDFKVDETLKNLGMKMVEKCKGLPLAIVVLGGLLRTKETLDDWQTVHQNIDSYLKRTKFIGGQVGTVFDVLDLSYQDLPYHLKACFLHLGNYPEDYEIDAETLYQLWMAEGIVSQEDRGDRETMMDVAECCLGELAQRCMVQVENYSPIRGSRRILYCQLHDLMRDLCLSKGKEENFLKVIENERIHPSSSSTEPSGSINGRKTHRLAIHRALSSVEREEQSAHHIRAVSFFMDEEFNYQAENELRCFSKNSKFLRVIHCEGISWHERQIELPTEIGNLILLRHLGLRGTSFRKLPSSIGKLRYLQTLDLRTMMSMSIPNVLWKMEGLIHIYFPEEFSIEGGVLLRLDGLSKLETIENLDPNQVDVGGFSKLTNLQRLTVRIQRKLDGLVVVNNYLLNSKHQLQYVSIDIIFCDFRSVEELSLLRMLLCCDYLVSLDIFGFISKLPECEFSPSLTSLTLKDSQLKEDPMATLEKLPNLRFLMLDSKAFVGKEMVCSAHGFHDLQYLTLCDLETLEEWKVDDGAMPNLSSLEIKGCKNLKMVPDGLRFISTLEKLVIRDMPIAFQDRLRVIDGEEGEDFQKIRHIPSIEFTW